METSAETWEPAARMICKAPQLLPSHTGLLWLAVARIFDFLTSCLNFDDKYEDAYSSYSVFSTSRTQLSTANFPHPQKNDQVSLTMPPTSALAPASTQTLLTLIFGLTATFLGLIAIWQTCKHRRRSLDRPTTKNPEEGHVMCLWLSPV